MRTWQIIAFIALLLSFLPEVAWAQSGMPGTNWPNAIALMLMHVVAWVFCVTLLPKLSAERSS
jgi:hypothetical protein